VKDELEKNAEESASVPVNLLKRNLPEDIEEKRVMFSQKQYTHCRNLKEAQ
jgi:hypothetical protein